MRNVLITLLFLILALVSMDAQRSRSRERDRDSREQENTLKESLWASLSLGNLYFFNDFSASVKASGGYRIVKPLSIGLQGKVYYDLLNRQPSDISLLTFGGGPEIRFDIASQFYLLGEYNIMSIEGSSFNGTVQRDTYTYPSVGFGYRSGSNPNSPSAQLLFILDEDVRNNDALGRPVDYWVEFVYFF